MTPFSNSTESPDNQAIRELRDELKDLNKNIKKANKAATVFTVALFAVAFFQLIVSVFQLAVALGGKYHAWIGLGLEIIVILGVAWAINYFFKNK